MRKWIRAAFFLLIFASMSVGGYWLWEYFKQPFDDVLAGGVVLDGTGTEPYRADIGIRNGRIAAIGSLRWARAKRRYSFRGLTVVPGFIDVHTHIESSFSDYGRSRVRAANFVRQGVTTLVTGNCGTSKLTLRPFLIRHGTAMEVNIATLVGHNSVRKKVMGEANRDPSPEELERMEGLVEQAMREGAFGLSTGLAYVPGSFARLPELVSLARVSARYGGLYVSHIRDEAAGGEAAIQEALSVGHDAGLPVQISHFKASGKGQWNTADKRLNLVRQAIRDGQQVGIDQYPYEFSSTTLDLLLPDELVASGQLRRAIREADGRRRVVDAILKKASLNGWQDLAFARFAWYGRDHELDGLNIPEVCGRLGHPCPTAQAQAAMVLELRLKGGGGQMLYHDMSPADVETIFRYPDTMIGTDSRIRDGEEEGRPHPRGYGTFPRILGQWVREKRLITLPDAVRRMTSLPARFFRLHDRGVIRPGAWADLVVFDSARVRDADEPNSPAASPTGILHVFVNGVLVLWDGEETLRYPGHALRRVSPTAGPTP